MAKMSHRCAWLGLVGGILAGAVAGAAAEPVVSAGVGAMRVGGKTPAPVGTTTVVGRGEVGGRLGSTTAARVRVEGYEVEGVNVVGALVVDVEVRPWGGVSGFAGVAWASATGPGSHVGGGVFARWPVGAAMAVRGDGFVSGGFRNDHGTYSVGLVVGVEWRP